MPDVIRLASAESTPTINESFRMCEFVEDIERLISKYIDRFFMHRKGKDGKPIPREVLHSSDNISLVLDTDMVKGVDMVYEALKEQGVCSQGEFVGEDTKWLIKLFLKCAHHGIPKPFAAGITILYLRYCLDIQKNQVI